MLIRTMNPYIKDSKAEVCRGGGVNRHSTHESCRWGGRGGDGWSIDIQLMKVEGGEGGEGREGRGGQRRGVDRHSTQEGCGWEERGGRGGGID